MSVFYAEMIFFKGEMHKCLYIFLIADNPAEDRQQPVRQGIPGLRPRRVVRKRPNLGPILGTFLSWT